MLGCKGFNWTVKDAKFVRCDILLPTIIKPHHNDNEICVYDTPHYGMQLVKL